MRLGIFAVCFLCMTGLLAAQEVPVPSPAPAPDSVRLADGSRVVLFGGNRLAAVEAAWLNGLGDRIRAVRPAIRVELYGAGSSKDALSRLDGDLLGRKPSHVILVPDATWTVEMVTGLLGEIGKEPDATILFWPEGSAAPNVPMLGPLHILPASLLEGKADAALEALARLLKI